MPRHYGVGRRSRSGLAADRTYCRHTDDGGYCCTSATHPGAVWCEAHDIMFQRGMDPLMGYTPEPRLSAVDPYSTARGSLPAVWTNNMTAEASQAALQNAGVTPANVAAATVAQPTAVAAAYQQQQLQAHATLPVGQVVPTGVSPPSPPVPLGTAIRGFEPFRFLVDHYGTADWVAEAIARPAVKSTTNQRKLAEYIASKSGIDVGDALDTVSSGKDIKLAASAGVAFADVVAEVAAREHLWKWHPYLQALVMRAGGSAEDQRVRRLDMIDALADSQDTDLGGEGYDSLFAKARLRIDALGLDINRLKTPPFPDLLPEPLPRYIATDVLMGKVSELASDPGTLALPEPQLQDMKEAIKRTRARMDSLNARMFCADAGSSSFDKTCGDWVSSKVAIMTDVPSDLSGYLDYANQHIPEFISLFK